MDTKINHIRNLIHFAFVDNHLHTKEKDLILKVGERLGIDNVIIEEEIKARGNSKPPLPANEVLRFILLDDILNLIVVDNIIEDGEISELKRVATDFGFQEEIIDSLVVKLRKHIENGFIANQTSLYIKDELFNLTSKNYSDAKYN